jgi:hypothetical protein
MSEHLTTTHRRPSYEYLCSSDGIINHYAANDIIRSDVQSCINMWIAGPNTAEWIISFITLQPSSYEWVLCSTVHPATFLYLDSNLNKLRNINKWGILQNLQNTFWNSVQQTGIQILTIAAFHTVIFQALSPLPHPWFWLGAIFATHLYSHL